MRCSGATEARRRPSTTAELPIVGAAPLARTWTRSRPGSRATGHRPRRTSRRSLVDRHGTEARARARGRARRRLRPSSTASRTSRPRSPGPPSTSSRCRSMTSSPAGSGSRPSSATVAPSIAPRVAAILAPILGWDAARQAARGVGLPRRRPPRVRRAGMTTPSTPVVLALDQGTTSSRAIAFDRAGTPVASAQREFPQTFPSPGHVTHDPEEIWSSQLAVAREVVEAGRRRRERRRDRHHEPARDDRRLGPRDRPAGRPRDRLAEPDHRPVLRPAARRRATSRSSASAPGLPLDAYFSGPKIRHILEEGGLRARAERGELAFGTVDSWLTWRLTGRPGPRHRRLERLADAPVRHPHARLGRRPARA